MPMELDNIVIPVAVAIASASISITITTALFLIVITLIIARKKSGGSILMLKLYFSKFGTCISINHSVSVFG